MFSMVLIVGQKLYNIFQSSETLTTDHRRTMNELVDAVNSQIVRFHSFPFIWSSRY